MSCFVAGASRWLEALFIGNKGGSDGSDASKVVWDESILPSLSMMKAPPAVLTPSAQPLFSSKIQKRRERDVADCLAFDALPQLKNKKQRSEIQAEDLGASPVSSNNQTRKFASSETKPQPSVGSQPKSSCLSQTTGSQAKRSNKNRKRFGRLTSGLVEGPTTTSEEAAQTRLFCQERSLSCVGYLDSTTPYQFWLKITSFLLRNSRATSC
jgi:hypothetical protein